MNDVMIRNPVLLVGIGGAGSKIAEAASSNVGCKCLFISNDSKDLSGRIGSSVLLDSAGWINPSGSKLRSFAQLRENEIGSAIRGYPTIIVVSNLAGRSGAAISPVVCKLAKQENAAVITIAIMPFKFEKDRLFGAGIALRRLRETSDSVVVMDNDAFLDNNPELPQQECYALTNSAIVEVITSISAGGVRPKVNVLCTSKTGSDSEASLRDSAAMLYQDVPEPASIKKTMVYVMGGDRVPVGELNRIASYVQGMFREEGSTEIAMSSVIASDGVRVHLVASAPQKTRFDRYDPLGDVIPKESFLDWDELDSAPDIDLAIPNIE